MTIEQRLAEAIRAFHLDALSSTVALNIDLDVVLTVLADAVFAALARRIPGYHDATPDTIQRRFIGTAGTVHPADDRVTVRLDERAYAPATRRRPPTHSRPLARRPHPSLRDRQNGSRIRRVKMGT